MLLTKVFSSLEFGNEGTFFRSHHATPPKAQSLDGQQSDVSEFKYDGYRVLLFVRRDTHTPFHLVVTKNGKPDFAIRYLSYKTSIPFDASLFKPPAGITITETTPSKGK